MAFVLSYANRESVEVLFSNFTRDLTNAYSYAYPIIVKNEKSFEVHKPYITSEIKTLIRRKNFRPKKFTKHPITYEDKIWKVWNYVSNLLKRAEASYYKYGYKSSASEGRKLGTWYLNLGL